MKKIFALAIATVALSSIVFAQTPVYQWAKSMGSAARDWGYGITADASGNSFVTGIFTGTVDFDPGAGIDNHTSNGGTDIFLVKFDPSGNFLWAKTFGSNSGPNDEKGTSVVTDASGNVYFTGWFLNTVDFDAGPGVANLTVSAPFTGAFVAKYDPAGNYIWAFQIGGDVPSTDGYGNGIAIDAFSNIYVTGMGDGNIDFDPGPGVATYNVNGSYFAKYTSSGAYVYGKGTAGGGVEFNSIAVDQSGNAVLTGELTTNTSDFDPGPGTANLTGVGVADVCLAKYDPSGNYLWAEQLNGTGFDYGVGVTVDQSNNIAITGYYENTLDLDPGAGVVSYTPSPTGVSDGFVAKYNASGNFIWGFPIASTGSELCQGITSDISGNVYVTGGYGGTTDFDPGPGTANLTLSGGRDTYVASYTSAGNYISAFKIGSPGGDVGFSIAVNSQGYMYVTGLITQTTDFDPSAATANITPTADGGNGDVFVAKYSPCSSSPAQPGSISGPTQYCAGITTTYSVTPVAGAASYSWTLPGGWTGTSTSNSITVTTSATSGTISVTANNACGSSAAQTLAVAISNISTTATSTNVSCFGQCDGTATGVPSGGFSPYSYLWNPPGGTSLTATGLCAGNYTFTVTDNAGCLATASVVITQPTAIIANATATPNTVCQGSCSNLDVTPSGGTPGYTYSWSPAAGLSSSTISNPVACPVTTTTYTCTITDANGCTQTTTASVTVHPTPSLVVSGGGFVCTGTDVCFASTGGLTYSWAGPCGFNSTLQNPCVTAIPIGCGGNYTVTGVDVNGCSNTATVAVAVNALPTVTYNETQTITCINWNPITLSAGTPAGGTYSGTAVSGNTFAPATAGAGTYNIIYSFTNPSGCTDADTSQITVSLCSGIQTVNEISGFAVSPNPFSNSVTIQCPYLNGTANIELFNVLGGLILTKQITGITTEIDLSALASGVYFIRVKSRDAVATKKIVKQ